jgi:hypothetical protein
MKFYIDSGTDIASHVLFDPTAQATPYGEDFDQAQARLNAEITEGRLLHIDTHSDGCIGYTVFVDEPLPDDLRARVVEHTPEILLRVPGGRLVAGGLEDLGGSMTKHTVEVPPGDYLVDAYRTDFDEGDFEPVLLRELGSSYRREWWASHIGALFLVGGFFVAIGGLVTWHPWVAVAGVASAGLGALVLALGPRDADYWRRKDEIENRFPPLALVLRRLPSDADASAYRGRTIDISSGKPSSAAKSP